MSDTWHTCDEHSNTHSVQQCPKSVSEFDFDDGGVGLRVLIDLNHGLGDAFLRNDLFLKWGTIV